MTISPPSILSAGLLAASATTGLAQGLLGIGGNSTADFGEESPLTWTASAGAGWDSNTYAQGDGMEQESAYVQGGAGVSYGWGSEVTNVNVGASGSLAHYLDQPEDVPGFDSNETTYNARVTFDITHRFTPRLTFSDNFYVTYEIEPDFAVGASVGRRSGQYAYYFNNAALSYAWTRRLSTVTSYAISGIAYEEDRVAEVEDRLTHIFAHQFRYLLDRNTSGVIEYRYSLTDYDALDADSTTHYLLVGVDHTFSQALSGSVRVGAQYYERDDFDDTAPYLEGSLNYRVSQQTSLRWYNRLGFEGSELAGFNSRYTYRTGVTANHRFTERLRGNAGVNFAYSDFSGAGVDVTENTYGLSLGGSYSVTPNIALTAGYNYINYTSDNVAREYDRHRVNAGVTATF